MKGPTLTRGGVRAPLSRTLIDVSEDDDLSRPIDITEASFGGLIIPAACVGTSIGFEVSDAEDGTYAPLTDADNNAITLTHTGSALSAAPLPPELFGFTWFRISPGTQSADVPFIVTLKG